DISLVNLSGSGMVGRSGFSGRLFSMLAREQINVVLITQSSSERSITFAVQPHDLLRTQELIGNEFELEIEAHKLVMPEIEDNLSILAIVGENMKNSPGMSGKLFHALGRNGINVRAIAQGSSELNISVIIAKSDLVKAMNAVHDAFFAQLNKTLNVFVAGTGNIKATFFEQLKQQHDFLLENNDLEIKIIGICNSRKQLVQSEGLSLEHWQSDLQTQGQPADFEKFVQLMEELNLPNCVFVDNTASQVLPDYYERIFSANISIVTCNKIANSGSYQQYFQLKTAARKYGVDFLYETNVGAGLPIVRVLNDLMLSGDRILKIEAILSGTISYLFNNYNNSRTFYDVVRQAHDLGYTEPDPRDDLNGTDFIRKMLILGRDAGYPIEAEEVSMVSIMPKACREASTVEAFYQQLALSESHFESMKNEAEAAGKVLRYIGKLEEGKVNISLEMVGTEHPFFHLSGSDNIIAFTTERYKDRPLLVRGPGAGAAVTAAGVFADLVKTM
ncbi:MAG TPA: ACT domain-containing protein, partial [Sphingobacteriaceae bacterium]|nr:ACT domain-containing protein [Sphingobacteriaceae bacterium]